MPYNFNFWDDGDDQQSGNPWADLDFFGSSQREQPSRFNFDFLGGPQQQQENPFEPTMRTARSRIADIAAPMYDTGPMQRYRDYLDSEPNRADYSPSIWRRLLAGASGGITAMESNIPQGFKVGQAILDQPYDNAYREWSARGKKIEADARLNDSMFQRQQQNYNNQMSRAIAEQQAETSRMRALTQNERDQSQIAYNEARIKDMQNRGWDRVSGADGNQVLVKVIDGELQTLPTNIPNEKMTVADQKRENQVRNDLTRLGILSANSRNAASIAAANARQQADQTFRATESEKNRNALAERARIRAEASGNKPQTFATPRAQIQKTYPDLLIPEFVQITSKGGGVAPKFDFTKPADVEKFKQVVTEKFPNYTLDQKREVARRYQMMLRDLGLWAQPPTRR
jgi:hypothetical protein